MRCLPRRPSSALSGTTTSMSTPATPIFMRYCTCAAHCLLRLFSLCWCPFGSTRNKSYRPMPRLSLKRPPPCINNRPTMKTKWMARRCAVSVGTLALGPPPSPNVANVALLPTFEYSDSEPHLQMRVDARSAALLSLPVQGLHPLCTSGLLPLLLRCRRALLVRSIAMG